MILGALPQKQAPRTDVAKAKADLLASGVGKSEVTLEYPSDATINGVSFATLAQKVQAGLQAVGFKIRLAGSPVTTFQPRFRSGKVAFGLWLYGFDYPDPVDYQVFLPGGLIAAHAGWKTGSDPAIEKLGAKALVTTAPGERSSLYRRIQLEMNARATVHAVDPAGPGVRRDLGPRPGAYFSGAYDVDVPCRSLRRKLSRQPGVAARSAGARSSRSRANIRSTRRPVARPIVPQAQARRLRSGTSRRSSADHTESRPLAPRSAVAARNKAPPLLLQHAVSLVTCSPGKPEGRPRVGSRLCASLFGRHLC